jgi:fatty acid amide hydrolase 2
MIPLTQRSAISLARSIRKAEVSSREVVEAHIELLERVNPAINAVVAPRLEEARAEADAVDARIAAASPRTKLPPLLGVPCTVKESIQVEGLPNSCGVLARRDVLSTETAPVAQRLLDSGAVLLGLTNVSEMTLWIETENRVHGRTRNPYDPNRIAGGSSGGEGAAVGSGLSPLGLGSDVGGSIRIPAFCNGVFGHKPSLGLVPLTGMWPPPGEGETLRLLVNGPLARRAEDLAPALKILAGPDGRDPVCREMEIGDPGKVSLDGMRVLVTEGPFLTPIDRSLLAAREQAAGALAAAGATVQRVSLRGGRRAMEQYLVALSDGGLNSAAALLLETGADPVGLRASLRRGGPHTVATRLLLAAERLSSKAPAGRNKRLLAAGRAFADELAALIGDGVMLHPPASRPAPRHGRTIGRPWFVHPMAVFNLAAVPVTQVPLGLGKDGIPLGVQVAAGRGNDHVSIAVALELERVFGGWVPPV